MEHATLRTGTYDDVHTQIEQLARDLDHHDYLAGTWLRELAIALTMNEDLVVSVVTYDHGGQELEVRLARASTSDGIIIGCGATGDQAQISLDLWVGIKDGPSVEQAVRLVQSLLHDSTYF
jgi:hypothetical protein